MMDAIRLFMAAALDDDPPSVKGLARSLDLLALAYADAPEGVCSEEDADPPAFDHEAISRRAVLRFPEFGFYAVADPLDMSADKPLVGDAINDIVDIVSDLSEVVWRHETGGPDDARWAFRFTYQIHWGRHLHDLRSYIHAKLCELGARPQASSNPS